VEGTFLKFLNLNGRLLGKAAAAVDFGLTFGPFEIDEETSP
jgi:hypothetical protein